MSEHGNKIPYDPLIADEICMAISTSPDGLAELCQQHPNWPSVRTIYRWIAEEDINEKHGFWRKYARARTLQAEVRVDHAYCVAFDSRRDWTTGDNGELIANHDHIARSRLQVDFIKWAASKLMPKMYGDVQEHKVTVSEVERQTRETENEYKKPC